MLPIFSLFLRTSVKKLSSRTATLRKRETSSGRIFQYSETIILYKVSFRSSSRQISDYPRTRIILHSSIQYPVKGNMLRWEVGDKMFITLLSENARGSEFSFTLLQTVVVFDYYEYLRCMGLKQLKHYYSATTQNRHHQSPSPHFSSNQKPPSELVTPKLHWLTTVYC
jgi:hypothetical protein